MRVLFAEDEKSLNRIITKQLKAAGYSVDSCFDGGEAYDLITSADYDAAVFDVTMPVMNGFELVKKVFLTSSQTRPVSLGSRLKGAAARCSARRARPSHVCEPSGIFSDVHAAGENDSYFLCACERKLCEALYTN